MNASKNRLEELSELSEDRPGTSRNIARSLAVPLLATLLLCGLLAAPSTLAATPTDTAALEAAASQEAAAEAEEEADAEAEEAQAAPQDMLAMKLRAKDRRGYVYKIHYLKHMIANALAKKTELKELPLTSKRRQIGLPEKREKLKFFRTRLREVRAELREKIYGV